MQESAKTPTPASLMEMNGIIIQMQLQLAGVL